MTISRGQMNRQLYNTGMMASAVGDESDDISMQLFGKPVKDLTPDQLRELQDEIERLMNKFRAQKEGGIMDVVPREQALFGGKIDHYGDNSFQHISEGIKEFIKTIKEEMEEEGSLPFKFKVDQEDTPTVDDILDKISKVGIKNLTNKEKEILNNYSNDK